MDKTEYLARLDKIKEKEDVWLDNIEAHSKEEDRVINVLKKADIILEQLESTFEERTSLKNCDIPILFLATALQLLRIYFMQKTLNEEDITKIERLDHNDKSIVKKEKDDLKKYGERYKNKWKEKESTKGYKTWIEILEDIKVPYDATIGSRNLGINMRGGNHRSKALGHDPILGWIFGVANIITDTISVAPEYKSREKSVRLPIIKSFTVAKGAWTGPIPTISVMKNELESVKEDKNRLYAAIFKQGVHLASDKYTKAGLPIPFLSLLDQDKAFEIYKNQFDYLDLQEEYEKFLNENLIIFKALASARYAIKINDIISAIHTFFYNPNKESDPKLYAVRTRKIVLYSNLIATSSDLIQAAIRAECVDANALKNIDFGGLVVTLYRLCSDTDFIMSVKEEFVLNNWENIIESKNNIYNI